MTRSSRDHYSMRIVKALFVAWLFVVPASVYAADAALFLSPITGQFMVGEEITLRIMVSTGAESTNAIEGTLRYDPKQLEIVRIDRANSILTSWTKEPTWNNETGELYFAGGMSGTTTFSGSRGEIFAFVIKGNRSEESRIEFASGAASAIYAADGTGGNILTALSNGIYVFSPKTINPDGGIVIPSDVPAEVTQSPSVGEVLGASTGTPALSSSSHPDQGAWYRSTTSLMQWQYPNGVSQVLLSMDKKPTGVGVVRYQSPTNTKTITDVGEGVWYVHLSAIGADGTEVTTHYRMQIDTTAPQELVVREVARADMTDPRITLAITATDTRSGIGNYVIAIDGQAPLTWSNEDGSGQYQLPTASSGEHEVKVTAVDRAGNSTSTTLQFKVEALPPPTITQKTPTSSFAEGSSLELSLKGQAHATLSIGIARDGETPSKEEYTLDASGSGIFQSMLVLQPGAYRVVATARMQTGAQSGESNAISFVVEPTLWGMMKRHPFLPVALLALLGLAAFGWFYWWRGDTEIADDETDEDDDAWDESEDDTPRQEVTNASQVGSAVVLTARAPKRVSLPPTRL